MTRRAAERCRITVPRGTPRSLLAYQTAPNVTMASPIVWIAISARRFRAAVCGDDDCRRPRVDAGEAEYHCEGERSPTAASERNALAIPTTKSSWIRIVPMLVAAVVRIRTTPDQMSSPASVTTNEGTPALVMTIPWAQPIIVVMRSATPIAAHAGHPGLSGRRRSAMTTPPTALTKATDRSISAMRSTKTTPMAIVAKTTICSRRLVKLRAE